MNRAAAPKQSGMNQQKFEELFSKYRSMVYRTAKSITGRRQDALDIQQTVFLRLIEQAETLESTANLAGYLYQTAVNEARQRFRSENRRNHRDDDVEFLLDPASDRHAGQNDRLERLLEALAQLEPEHAEMLILWSVHGYSDAQIGEMLGKTRGAVAVTLHRAKARLKELLGGGESTREKNNETR